MRLWLTICQLPLLVIALGMSKGAILSPASASTLTRDCRLGDSTHASVTITSCQYHLGDSPAGNSNYYLLVDINYTASRPVSAVRFAFNIDGQMRYMVARQNLQNGKASVHFQMVSPATTVTNVICWADQST
jgi:hypothetical protein